MEVVKMSASGIAKLTGVALCLAGVFSIAFYSGPALSPVNHHRAFATHASGSGHTTNASSKTAWIEGTFLMILANMAWSISIIWQVSINLLISLSLIASMIEPRCVQQIRTAD
jgi:hypothetical protein